MIETVLLICVACALNCAYATAGLWAAVRCGIELRLRAGPGCAILLCGTTIEAFALALSHDGTMRAAMLVAFGAVITAAACDAACGYVFDAITLPCIAMMLAVSLISQTIGACALGAIAAGGCLFALYAITRGRGLGLGDVKLACCIGAAAGALGGVEALGIAFVLGGMWAAFLLLTRRERLGAEIRFAPYLAAGMALIMIHGPWS